jgi:hypothetical protein
MPEQPTDFSWTLLEHGQLQKYEFSQDSGLLTRNHETSLLTTPASLVLGVLLTHADAPVTSDDFLEAGLQTRGGGALRKTVKDLINHDVVGRHILQVGENKRSVYGFSTNPYDLDLLYRRMDYMHAQLYKGDDSDTARRHSELVKKLGVVVGVAAAASVAGFAVVKYVHKRR